MRLRSNSLTRLFSFSLCLNMILCTWAASSAALQFQIDPATSMYEPALGLGTPPPPGPLAGIIEIDFDATANTATLMSINVRRDAK